MWCGLSWLWKIRCTGTSGDRIGHIGGEKKDSWREGKKKERDNENKE